MASHSPEETLNRYLLEILHSDVMTDVESFIGHEALSTPYRYTIRFTSPIKDISPKDILNQQATLLMRAPNTAWSTYIESSEKWLETRRIEGIFTAFERISTSADESLYEVELSHPLALLERTRRHAIYLDTTVPELVKQILKGHNFEGYEIDFDNLSCRYPHREMITQWGETDLQFIRRLLSEVGIWFRFEAHPEHAFIIVMVFADSQQRYIFDHKINHVDTSGLSSNSYAVHSLKARHCIVPAEVVVRNYDYRLGGAQTLETQADIARQDMTTYGSEYHYADIHHAPGDRWQKDQEAETTWFYARIRHEFLLNQQTQLSATADSPDITPGMELTIAGDIPEAFASGFIVTTMVAEASRKNAYCVELSGIPYSEEICFRPERLPRPCISGTVPARVSSLTANDRYAHLDAKGRYWVKFDFDRQDEEKGHESMLVRLARPYAGDTYGHHFPLLDNTEVGIAFEGGDPERPYIAYAMHDEHNPDVVTHRNNTRNVIRTPANNKIRLEDKRGEEHIKVATELGKTQLNMGHLVNAEHALRGEGFEVRTDKKGTLRAAEGILVTTEPQTRAQGKQLDMSATIRQLEQALTLAKTLQQSASIAQATPVDATKQQQLQQALNGLSQPGMLHYADAGIALVTPASLQLSAGEDMVLTAGNSSSINILKNLSVAVGQGISAFARKLGIKLIAASGDVTMQAQKGAIGILADQQFSMTSVNGQMVLSAKKGLQLVCGGGGLRVNTDGSVEIFSPTKISQKAPVLVYQDGESVKTMAPAFESGTFARRFALHADGDPKQVIAYQKFRLTKSNGEAVEGITDAQGCSPLLDMTDLEQVTMELLHGETA